LKKKVIIAVVLVLILTMGIILIVLSKNEKNIELGNNVDSITIDEKEDNDNLEELEKENINTESETNNTKSITDNSNSNQKTEKQETATTEQNSSTSNISTNENKSSNNNISESNSSISTNNNTQASTSKTEDKTIDTSHPEYYIHKGRIDCTDSSECMDKSLPIQFKYNKVISNAYYVEVAAKDGTVLGYFIQYVFKEYTYSSDEECNKQGIEIKSTLLEIVTGYSCNNGTLKITTDY
jgi:hypothetical protein